MYHLGNFPESPLLFCQWQAAQMGIRRSLYKCQSNKCGNTVLSAFRNKSDKEEEALPRLATTDEVDPIIDISMDIYR